MATTSAKVFDTIVVSSNDIQTLGAQTPVSGEPGVSLRYRNSVWDTQKAGNDKTHYWSTYTSPDVNGIYYDGPGTWDTHTSDFSSLLAGVEATEEPNYHTESNLWTPPESPHAQDDEFDQSTLGSEWYNYSVPAGAYGTISYTTPDIYDTTFNSGDALRVSASPDERRSWLLCQPPQSRFMIFGKSYTAPANLLVVARLKFNQYYQSSVSGDRHIGLMFQGDTTGKPDWNNRMNLYLNLAGTGTVRASMFQTVSGSDSGHLYTTDVDQKGQALEYVAIHKLGTTYHGWVGTAGGNWIWLGPFSSFTTTIQHVTVGLYTVSNDKPAVTVFGIDFIRFYETDNFLF